MVDVIGYVTVALLITGFTYLFVRQIQHTMTIQKTNKVEVPNYNRLMFGNYLMCVSFLGFLISYLLNILVAMQIMQLTIVTSENTSFSCFVFLLILLVAKLGVIHKKSYVLQKLFFILK